MGGGARKGEEGGKGGVESSLNGLVFMQAFQHPHRCLIVMLYNYNHSLKCWEGLCQNTYLLHLAKCTG